VITKAYLDSSFGQLHYATSGDSGRHILFFHQSPRSWAEFEFVLPLVGRVHRAYAMDTLGYGSSARTPGDQSVEQFADAACELIEELALDRVVMVGHHTGSAIGIEVAARLGDRVGGLILSGPVLVDAADRGRKTFRPPVDWVQLRHDGEHLVHLWRRREMYYRPGEHRLENRFIRDAVRVIETVEDGHRAVHDYHMDERLPLVKCPAKVICGEEDFVSLADSERLAVLLDCDLDVIPEGGVPLPEQQPAAFARSVVAFVDSLA
jgi:pimeloyl-ACP methyl ester carboxylesterase